MKWIIIGVAMVASASGSRQLALQVRHDFGGIQVLLIITNMWLAGILAALIAQGLG
jgi:hypothetical protein